MYILFELKMKLGYDMVAVSATLEAMCSHLKNINRPVASVIFRKYVANEILYFLNVECEERKVRFHDFFCESSIYAWGNDEFEMDNNMLYQMKHSNLRPMEFAGLAFSLFVNGPRDNKETHNYSQITIKSIRALLKSRLNEKDKKNVWKLIQQYEKRHDIDKKARNQVNTLIFIKNVLLVSLYVIFLCFYFKNMLQTIRFVSYSNRHNIILLNNSPEINSYILCNKYPDVPANCTVVYKI